MQEATILVVSPGRCASSFVAEILHRDLNIPMGRCFMSGNEYNPRGYWEDLYIADLNTSLVEGRIRFQLFSRCLLRYIGSKNRDHAVWGVKNTFLGSLLGLYLPLLRNPRFIRLRRNAEDVALSMLRLYTSDRNTPDFGNRVYGGLGYDVTSLQDLGRMVLDFEHVFDCLLAGRDVLELDFNTKRTKSYVVDEVRDFMRRTGCADCIPTEKARPPVFYRRYSLRLLTADIEGEGWVGSEENLERYMAEKGLKRKKFKDASRKGEKD